MRAAEAAAAAVAALVLAAVALAAARGGGMAAWAAPLSRAEREDLGILGGVENAAAAAAGGVRARAGWEHALAAMLGDAPAAAAQNRVADAADAAVDAADAEDDVKTGAERFAGPGWRREIFLTTHGGNAKRATAGNNVRVYSYEVANSHLHHWDQDGLAIQPRRVKTLGLQNLRGMAAVGPALFVASAHSSRSKIVLLHKCNKDDQTAKTFAIDDLDHPYGIAFFRGALYASNQNTNEIVRFYLTDGLGAKAHKFAHVPHPRGLAFDRAGRLWAASTKQGVFVLDQRGNTVKQIDVTHAVGVAVDLEGSGIVYVGSVDGKNSAVYGFSPVNFKPVVKLTVPAPHKLTHPAGLAIVDDRLLVVAQDEQVLYAFCTRTGTFKGAVLKDLPHRPEQVALLRCK